MRKFFLYSALFFSYAAFSQQNVGLGTNSPVTKLDVQGGIALREGTALSLSSSTSNDNVALAGNYSFYRITGPAGAFAITGLVPVTNADGQIVTLVNTTGFAMTLKNNAVSSPANQVTTLTGADITSNTGPASVTLQYNKTAAKWYVTATQNFTVSAGSLATHNITPGTGSAVTVSNGTGQVVGGGDVVLDVAANALNQKGTVPGPTGGNTNQVWGTDGSGNPAWEAVRNNMLSNSSVTVNPGTGMSGGGAVALGSSIILTNAGVTSNVAGTGIGISGATGAVTISNTGVTALTGGSGISVSGSTGSVTITNTGAPASGSASYIQNQNAGQQSGSGFWTAGTGEIDGGILTMGNGTSNLISLNTNGVAAPAFTTRSTGAKIVLYPQISGTSVDYSLGISSNTFWYTVPQGTSAYAHAFFAGTTELMRIRGDGNVGIGTTAPQRSLEIAYGISSNTALELNGGRTGAGLNSILFTNSYWTDNGTYGSAYLGGGDDGSQGGYLAFATTTDASGVTGTPAERMRIINNGNIGIGTTVPNANLSFGTGINTNKIYLFDGGSGGKYGFGIAGGTLQIYAGADLTTNRITFGYFDGTTFTENVRFQNNGNTGIGTTGPLSKLDVNGGVAIGSYAGNNAAPSNGLIVSGNAGIGINTPAYSGNGTGTTASGAAPLELSATGDNPYLQINTTSTTNNRSRINFSQNGVLGMEIGSDYTTANLTDMYIYNRASGTAAAYFYPGHTVWLSPRATPTDLAVNSTGIVTVGTLAASGTAFHVVYADASGNLYTTANMVLTSTSQADASNLPSGTYTFNFTGSTGAQQLYYQANIFGSGTGGVLVFSSPYASTATVNMVGKSFPFTKYLIETSTGSTSATAYFSSAQLFNTGSPATAASGGDHAGYYVYTGYGGGMGIYNTTQLPCNWSNSVGAVGAGYIGGSTGCGAYPNDLIWGVGNSGSPYYSTIGGTWQIWIGN